MGVPIVDSNVYRADNRAQIINCNTGIPMLDASLWNSYSRKERIEIANKVFGKPKKRKKIKIKRNKK